MTWTPRRRAAAVAVLAGCLLQGCTSSLLESGHRPDEALTSGFSYGFWVAAGFAFVSLLTTLLVLRQEDLPAVGAEAEPVPAG